MSALKNFELFEFSNGYNGFKYGALLSDYKYWTDHQVDLQRWTTVHGAVQYGSILYFPNQKTQTLFALTFEVERGEVQS